MAMTVRAKRQIIYFSYHAGVIGISLTGANLGMAVNNSGLTEASAYFLIAHLLTFKVIPVSRWLQEKLIPEAICPSCGSAVDLTNLYRCGCGFVPYKERHVFTPCPYCGKSFEWIICPECETSIVI